MMRMRLLLLAACAWGVAQAAFQEVAWVEATGAQWINTRYVPACTDRFEMKVAFTETSVTQTLWCTRGDAATANTMTCFIQAPGRFRFDRNSNTSTYTADNLVGTDGTHVIVADYGTREASVDGTVQATMADGDFAAKSPLVLFASQRAYRSISAFARVRLFSFRILNAEGTLVRDFVPVRDAATEACGLFEKVTDVFFPGLGREALVAGDVVADGAAYEERFDGYAVVDVPEGETRTLTADDVAAFGAQPLVKTGLGTLVAGAEMADFPGDILIRAGQYKATHAGAFGTAAGVTYVDGGTIWSTVGAPHTWTNEGGLPAYGDERFCLRGEGFDGRGAVYQSDRGCLNFAGRGGIVFEGPVRLGGTQTLEFRYGFVDFNHCPLTVAQTFRLVSLGVTGFRSVDVESGYFGLESGTDADKTTAANAITVHDAAGFWLNSTKAYDPRALVFGKGTTFKVGGNAATIEPGPLTGVDGWSGPISFADDLAIRFDARGKPLNLAGPVSGAGGLCVTGGGYLQLNNPGNSFTGGIAVQGVTAAGSGDLNVTGGVTVVEGPAAATSAQGVIPVDGGALALKDARLTVAADRRIDLPDLVAEGKVVVSGLTAVTSFKSLTKKAAGTLTVFGPAKILGDADIREGTLRFGTRPDVAGLNWHYAYGTAGGHTTAALPANVAWQGVDRRGVSYAYEDWKTTVGTNNAPTHLQCHYYTGYIKVPGEPGTSVTCNFISSIARHSSLVIDGQYVTKVSDNKDDLTGTTLSYKRCVVGPTVTLEAGWHAILVFMGNYWNATAGGVDCDKPVWPANFGFGVDWQGRCEANTANYVKLLDPGDGSFLRTAVDEAEKATLDPTPFRPTFHGAVSFGPGAALDVNDAPPYTPVVLPELKGLPTIRNGAVTVTSPTWTIRASDFAAGVKPLTVEAGASLTFAEGTAFAFEGDFDALSHAGADKTRRLVSTAGGTIGNLPAPAGRVGTSDWYVRPSADGKGYDICYARGMVFVLR
mgnify:FL=1